jgi:hypothetical protein
MTRITLLMPFLLLLHVMYRIILIPADIAQ